MAESDTKDKETEAAKTVTEDENEGVRETNNEEAEFKSEVDSKNETETEATIESKIEIENGNEVEIEPAIESINETENETPIESTKETENEAPIASTNETENEAPIESVNATENETAIEPTNKTQKEAAIESKNEATAKSETEAAPESENEATVEAKNETEAESKIKTENEVSVENKNETENETVVESKNQNEHEIHEISLIDTCAEEETNEVKQTVVKVPLVSTESLESSISTDVVTNITSVTSTVITTSSNITTCKKAITTRIANSSAAAEINGAKPNPILKPNPDLDLVDEKLYLGNLKAACDIPLLKRYDIKYILTVDSYPLPSTITDLPFLKAKYIRVCDIPKEDILHYFEQSFNFLENAITNEQSGGNILVHCNVGVSRSATIVLAYMMRKYRLTLEEAQEKLRSKRSVIGPNTGFLSQLKLYEKMNYRIDSCNEFYKKFRLHVAADKIKSAKILAPPYSDVIKKDPGVCTVRPEPVVYRCRKCRRILASASNLITHREKRSSHWYEFDFEEGQGGKVDTSNNEKKEDEETGANPAAAAPKIVETKGAICNQMIFIEPISWMANINVTPNGKLLCPNANCKSKLGSFSWTMNCICPCGAKIQPAFYLVPSKVDRSTSVLNLQITI